VNDVYAYLYITVTRDAHRCLVTPCCCSSSSSSSTWQCDVIYRRAVIGSVWLRLRTPCNYFIITVSLSD